MFELDENKKEEYFALIEKYRYIFKQIYKRSVKVNIKMYKKLKIKMYKKCN